MIKGGITKVQCIADRDVEINTGVLAKQANGSVTIKCGDMVLLATATMSKKPKEGINFFPLTLEFSEKMYASGKIPGGFFKREARPSTDATLTARLIDRPLRPSFPKGLYNEVQIIITVLSYDETVPMEPLAMVAASAAVSVSDIPFNGPVGGVLVAQIDGDFVGNPSPKDLERSTLEIIVAGTKDAILMVESEAKEVSEETIIDAIMFGHTIIKDTITLQEQVVSEVRKEKAPLPDENPELPVLIEKVTTLIGTEIHTKLTGGNKEDIDALLTTLETRVLTELVSEESDNEGLVKTAFNTVKKEQIRNTILEKKVRPDGRALDEIRPIDVQVDVLPSTHGSALFTRGETQSLGVVTLGTEDDEQLIDGLDEKSTNNYYFHYNFPPFSVGECGRMFTGRRELGHGALAQRALKSVIPTKEEFPYTIRIVSEILESNGSSSMASVCSGSLSLMDCGVPIKAPVSGIAMGLLIKDNEYVILSDIQGLEDHYGDMDFKVAGTENGITALQLDIKISGLSKEILEQALQQAKEGRLHILKKMTDVLDQSRNTVAENAPKIHSFPINPEKVGLVIGPGGKTIRKIEEETKAKISISDGSTGIISIAAKDQTQLDAAYQMIMGIVKDPEVGDVYNGKVVKIVQFGAFIELSPGKEGLIHISKLSEKRVNSVEDIINVGDKVEVKVKEIDNQNRINLIPVTPY
jgi:polyribonucleotide nucleotidyltransferase